MGRRPLRDCLQTVDNAWFNKVACDKFGPPASRSSWPRMVPPSGQFACDYDGNSAMATSTGGLSAASTFGLNEDP
jgi:hypothetical protein